MEMRLVPHSRDSEMVEVRSLDERYLYCVMHMDSFIDDREIYNQIYHKKNEIIIKIEMQPF